MEKYEKPVMEIVKLDNDDVIQTSGYWTEYVTISMDPNYPIEY